jgi:geranylgeranylglycerol-phosphate geranylgeranyltransferase
MKKKDIYSFFSIKFWRAYLITMRPYLLFVSGSAGLVGLAFIKEPDIIRTILAFIPLFLSYGLGQALTDCFQTDTDAISSPYRPLVKGIISKKQVLSVSLTGLLAAVIILAYLNPKIIIFGILSVIGLLTYTYLKRTWWGGPPWNSWIVALLPIMGRFTNRDYHIKELVNLGNPYSLSFFLAVAAVFFAYANFVVMGYFKDISADRKTGYNTFPVVFGWKPAAIYSDLTALAAAILTGCVLFLSGKFNIWGIGIFVIATVINLYAQIKLHLTRVESKTHGPIGNVVRSFILYCIAMIVSLKYDWIIIIVVFYLLFELTLKIRPEKSQV